MVPVAVKLYDVTCSVLIDLHLDTTLPKGQSIAELGGTHTIAESKDTGLTDEAFELVSLRNLAAIDLTGELGVHITPLAEGLEQIALV